MLGLVGWVLVGAVLTGALLYFWNDIRDWLNNTAANAVERALGYNARKTMQRAVCNVDRVVNNLRTRAVVYNKKNPLDTHYDRVMLEATAPVYEIDNEVLQKIEEQGELVQEMKFKG